MTFDRRLGRLAVLLALAGTAPAFAQSSAPMPGMSSADMAFSKGMSAMQHDMAAAPMTGDTDQDFVAAMIPHHKGAVAMAEVELKHGHDAYLRRLAKDIVAAQEREIAAMTYWQKHHPLPAAKGTKP
jgi:uncharacterized protein (DUF305 family)